MTALGKRESEEKTRSKTRHNHAVDANERDKGWGAAVRLNRFDVLVCVVLIAATLAVYWQIRNHDFIYLDDSRYITNNRHIQGGVTTESIIWALTATDISYWQPMTWLSLMLDYELYGLNPLGYHLTNLLLHALSTLLLFLVLRKMTGSLWRSAFVASLFALHPLNVESVAWAAERKNVLSTFFWMLAMISYVRYAERPRLNRYFLLVLTFALGLMTKPMLVTLPFVLLLLDYWPLGRLRLRYSENADHEKTSEPVISGYQETSFYLVVLEKIPLLTLSGVAIYVSSLSVKAAGTVISTEVVPMSLRITNALVSYVSYMGKMLWPKNLAILYPYPSMVPVLQSVGAGLLLASVSVLAILFLRRLPYLAVGWLWYLGTLVPVIGLKQTGLWPAVADRFAYVPLIGLFVIVAWGIPELLGRWRYRMIVLALAAGTAVSALTICCWLQVQLWENSLTLFEHTLRVTDNNFAMHNSLGVALMKNGRLKEAMRHYSKALEIKPDYADAHYNLGVVLADLGNVDQAISHYLQALRLKPGYAKAHNNLGNALLRQGRYDEAIAHYSQALRLKADDELTHNNLGNALLRQGRLAEAISHYSQALRLKPDDALAHNNLGNALLRQGRYDEAIAHYSQALRLKPDDELTHNNMGIALMQQGRLAEAIVQFSEALKLKPGYAKAHSNMGIALMRQGRLAEAIVQFSEALKLKPGYAKAHNNLGVVLMRQGRLDEAIVQFSEALKLKPDYVDARRNLKLALEQAN